MYVLICIYYIHVYIDTLQSVDQEEQTTKKGKRLYLERSA